MNHLSKRFMAITGLLIVTALALAACQATPVVNIPTAGVPNTGGNATATTNGNVTPTVVVANQPIVDGTVTVSLVDSSGPGWIVIHADNNGQPGTIIGHAAVQPGENTNVAVTIDTTKATKTLYAMLHQDAGVVGTFEFPGADTPVTVNGQIVSPSFQVLNLGLGSGTVQPETTENAPGFDAGTPLPK